MTQPPVKQIESSTPRPSGARKVASRVDAVLQAKTLLTPSMPVGGWRRFLADSATAGGATIFGQVLGAGTAILLRMLLSPIQIGIWQGLKLALSYGNYAGLGVSKAAAREVSLASGQQAAPQLSRSINLAFTVNTLTSLGYALILVAVATVVTWGQSELATEWSVGFIAIAALAMLQRYTTFRVTLLRANHRVRATSLLALQESVLTVLTTGICVWLWGLVGLYTATALVMISSLWFLQRRREHQFQFAWDGAEVRRLMKIGAPLLAAGIVSSLFRSMDKLFVLATIADGEFQLGCYSTALLVSIQIYGLANVFSGVCGPRLTQAVGVNRNSTSVAALAARFMEMISVVLSLPAAIAVCFAPPLLMSFLPEYQAGLPALIPTVCGALALGLSLPAQHCLVAWNRGRGVLGAMVAGTVLAFFLNGIAVATGGGVLRIAIATALANLAYLSLVLSMTMRAVPRAELVKQLIATGVALIPCGLAMLLSMNTPGMSWGQATLASGICLLVWLLIIVCGWNRFRWSEFLTRGASN
ncbi:MAG: lipopolysaccharide biosynthesis protein [Pirellulales bacterium]|nr:lipopolysaccharide biosynthesis protein [Pirellulales bacterium]